jgi:hypothetical protein
MKDDIRMNKGIGRFLIMVVWKNKFYKWMKDYIKMNKGIGRFLIMVVWKIMFLKSNKTQKRL